MIFTATVKKKHAFEAWIKLKVPVTGRNGILMETAKTPFWNQWEVADAPLHVRYGNLISRSKKNCNSWDHWCCAEGKYLCS